MNMFFEEPWWDLLAVAGLPFAAMAWWKFHALGRIRRAIAVVLRAGVIAIAAALLAGLSIVKSTNKLAVIAVIDESGSVQRFFSPSKSAEE